MLKLVQNQFEIKSLIITPARDFQGESWDVTATVYIDGPTWKDYNKNHNLGMLYGVDIGNKIYKMYSQINTFYPTIDHSARCKDGRKKVILRYSLSSRFGAEALGCKVTAFGTPVYGDHVSLPIKPD